MRAMGRVKKNKPRGFRMPRSEDVEERPEPVGPAVPAAFGGPEVVHERPIVTATLDLVAALKAYADAVDANRELLKVVALPAKLAWIAQYAAPDEPMEDYYGRLIPAEPDEPVRDLAALRDAWAVVDLNLPVAGAAPHSPQRADESHRRWRGPLEPEELLHMAEIAGPGAVGYRRQLRENTAYFDAREKRVREDQEFLCGHPNQAGDDGCRLRPVYAPGVGWRGGLHCWRHVTAAEKAALDRAYGQAIADHDCPGCIAKAGKPCHTGEGAARYMRLVDGEWAQVRSYSGHKVHDARLDLVEFDRSLAPA